MWPAFGGPCEAQPYPSAQPYPAEYGCGDPSGQGCPAACPWAGACPGARYSLPSLPPSLPPAGIAGTVMGEDPRRGPMVMGQPVPLPLRSPRAGGATPRGADGSGTPRGGGGTPRGGGGTPRGGGGTPRGGGGTPRGGGGTPRGGGGTPRAVEPDFMLAARAATPREHRRKPLPAHVHDPYAASEVHHAVPLPVGAGQYYEAGQYYGTGPQQPYYGAGAGQYQQPAGPGEEDYEVWPSMQDALPPAAELGPQSQRGGGGAPSHRAQHTDVPSQPDYNDKGTYSSAPSFQQRL